MRSSDDPFRGIIYVVCATLLFASSDTISKYLSGSLPIIEFIWIRYVLNVVFALCLPRPAPRPARLSRHPVWQTLRGLCTAGSSVLFVLGVSQMTMAQATTISFLSPLLVTILSIPLLREVVGLRRRGAVAAGIAGMLIVVRPGFGGFQPAALFGVGSSACWALALILTRKLAADDPPRTTALWSAATGAVVLSVALPFQAVWPSGWQLGLSLAMGVVATGGQWLVILAHRAAAASVLAPIFYAQLLWSTLGGYLVFHSLPDEWTALGAAIIIASGLYTAHRERVRRGQDWAGPARTAPGAVSQSTQAVAKSRVAV